MHLKTYERSPISASAEYSNCHFPDSNDITTETTEKKFYVLLYSTALLAQLVDLRGSKNPLLNNTALHDCCRRTDIAKCSIDSLYSFVPF